MSQRQKPSQSGPEPFPGRAWGKIQVQVSKGVLRLACAAVLLSVMLAAIGGFLLGRHRPAGIQTEKPELVDGSTRIRTCSANPGPWGDLECQHTVIEVAEENVAVRSRESARSHWFFKGFSPVTLSNRLAGLSGSVRRQLLDPASWAVSTNGIDVQVPLKTILTLSPPDRKAIYSVLGQFEENASQHHPFHWPIDAKEDLFVGAHLCEETRTLFLRLCYTQGKYLLFADHAAILSAVSDPAEKIALAKVLSRRYALFVSLKLEPKPDLESIISYWGRGGHARDIRPILEAITRSGAEKKIGIGVLLPPFVRAHLYRFPPFDDGPQPDAHWTAFNFWEDPPAPPTLEGGFWRAKLKADYVPVSDRPNYGDLVLLSKADGQIIHSCVYLADNIVYTKNGAGPGVPWELMTLPDLQEYFSWDLPENESLRLYYFRLKEIRHS